MLIFGVEMEILGVGTGVGREILGGGADNSSPDESDVSEDKNEANAGGSGLGTDLTTSAFGFSITAGVTSFECVHLFNLQASLSIRHKTIVPYML